MGLGSPGKLLISFPNLGFKMGGWGPNFSTFKGLQKVQLRPQKFFPFKVGNFKFWARLGDFWKRVSGPPREGTFREGGGE